jgi:GH24 family phage-related lysozyme (muramidase)
MTTDKKGIAKKGGALVLGGAAIVAALTLWEKQELFVYADKLAGGLPTYCSGRTHPPRPVGEALTKQECDAIDRQTTIEYGKAVLKCIPADKFDQNSFDAFTLFTVNVGPTAACGSRAARLMREGKREEACKALATGLGGAPAWSYAAGVYVRGLQNRRQYEKNWCLTAAEGGA